MKEEEAAVKKNTQETNPRSFLSQSQLREQMAAIRTEINW